MAKIILENLEVHYPVYGHHQHSLRRTLVNMTTGGRIYGEERNLTLVKALDQISFHLKPGDRLGLIGNNGAGKSTLLKVLGHFLMPSSGKLIMEGKVSLLTDVCMGMDMDRTGHSNIFYMGMLLGLNKSQIKQRISEIEEFCELGDFLNMPVRTYSSGMKVRLGFAITTCIEPHILLLDEAIGAGDQHFIEKAAVRAKSLYNRAEILVIASHSNDIIRQFCNKVLWMHQGKMVLFGAVEDVLNTYETDPSFFEKVNRDELLLG
jgi:ABC-type polysaccharide/polyol phosphate transport system ATPase subunit